MKSIVQLTKAMGQEDRILTLTKEQKDFGNGVSPILNDTPAKLIEFFKPLIKEIEIVREFKSRFFGDVDLGCSFVGCGCISPIVFLFVLFVMGIVSTALGYGHKVTYIYGFTAFLALTETIFIVYFYNSRFYKKHEPMSGDVDLLAKLIMPLVGFVSQDMKEDEKIELNSSLTPLDHDRNSLSYQEIKKMGKKMKKGLNVYSGNLLSLSTQLADGTKVTFEISGVVSKVYVYKKRGGSKKSRKEKYTIKSVFDLPIKTYHPLPEGDLDLNLENATASVVNGEKFQKISVKKVIEMNSDCSSTSLVDYNSLLDSCIDSMAAVYSQIGVN